LEAFGRRPPVHAAPLVSGRHPKPFTLADVAAYSIISAAGDHPTFT
jgi:hypothetical protein